ncbi:MAG: hypothetical protein HC925_06295 [Coleofasciculaceae cyanobacterium SM2_3_26]|nr:hypothetical protein [Coleofasciculaceae cyanobacterium SM2_3_26]
MFHLLHLGFNFLSLLFHGFLCLFSPVDRPSGRGWAVGFGAACRLPAEIGWQGLLNLKTLAYVEPDWTP